MLARLRLSQLLSPTLPIGTYSYSQGLEWAVEAEWINDQNTVSQWLAELIAGPLTYQELPLLSRLYRSSSRGDITLFEHWSHMLLACRDTMELRHEELARGAALLSLLSTLENSNLNTVKHILAKTPLAGFGWAAATWSIGESDLLTAYCYAWLEAQVISAVKLIPLGQSAGQRIIYALSPALSLAIEQVDKVQDKQIGFASPAQSFASCRHETQYCRLYRS